MAPKDDACHTFFGQDTDCYATSADPPGAHKGTAGSFEQITCSRFFLAVLLNACGIIHALFVIFAYYEQWKRTEILKSHAGWLQFYQWMGGIYAVATVVLVLVYGLQMACPPILISHGNDAITCHIVYYGSSMLVFWACAGLVYTAENPTDPADPPDAGLYIVTQLLFVVASATTGRGWWNALISVGPDNKSRHGYDPVCLNT